MDTTAARYEQLTDRLLSLYREGKQREALKLLDPPDPELAPWAAELAHFEACMHGSLGDPDSALEVLLRASAAGAWWHHSLLVEDDDLAALREVPEFKQLVEFSQGRKVNDQPAWTIDLPDAERPLLGVVVALHGTGQRATRAAKVWAAVVELGYALVCVDSSQLISPQFRTWLERDLVVRDIAAALDALPDELSGLPVIAAGFSSGGRAALEWALTAEPTAVRGVIVLAPSLGDLPVTAAGPLSPATILVGTEDHALSSVDRAADQLATFGIDIIRIPGLGHTAPEDLDGRLAALLTVPIDRT
ncbi:alpha/beta hydrolase [Kribbella sp. NPDC051718]|uniref:alpha/beta hydrolase n=1 Tax=Kribbella sp. NPDC051718 TaxID=3155168 RepID=UPI00341A2F3A